MIEPKAHSRRCGCFFVCRYLQQNVETLIGRRIVEGNLHAGDVLTIDAKDGTLSVEAAPKD